MTHRPRASYREAVRAELVKLTTLRSTWFVLAALAASLPALAVIVAATESLQPDDTILGASVLGGAIIAQLLAGSLGATLVTAEHRTGTILTTMAALPRRPAVLAAKATVAAATVVVITLPSAALAYTLGVVLLDGDRYATGQPFPALVGVSLAIAAVAVLGVAVGTIVRHSAGAVGVVIGLVLLPGFFAPLLGGLERWVAGVSSNGVLAKLAQSSDATPEAVGNLGAWPSLAVALAATALVTLASGWLLERRDL